MTNAIILFTRVPVPGKTKTRLMPYLSAAQCARLHECFLRDIKGQCEKTEAALFICYTPEDETERLYHTLGKAAGYFPQEGETLGERMYNAIARVLGEGYAACVLLGSDVPEVREAHISRAFRALEEKDVVFGPTRDGGYYLVGMKKPYKEVFEKQSYGHGKVLANTVRSLKEKELTVGYTATLSDMDVPEDLRRYRSRMCANRKMQSTETGKYLMRTSRISVIVPVYNEEKTIVRLQEQLKPYLKSCEVLLVDGGSTDRTPELIDPAFRVLKCEKGRAKQMNLGARKSHGDILFFLHSDSELPRNFPAQIRYVMKDYEAGCFGVAFHSKNFFMLTCRLISNHRVKDRKLMFGDQGIFLKRELFFEVGMYPELPIMEDYQLSLTLKERGVRLGMAKHRIYTSDRRFPKGTLPKLKVMWQMNRLRKGYRAHVPAEELAKWYQDVR